MNQTVKIKKKWKHHVTKIIGFFSIIYFLTLAPSVYADFNVGVYPPILQINAIAPTAIRESITLVNESNSAITLIAVFKPFTQDIQDNGHVQYLSENDYLGADPKIFNRMQLLDSNGRPMTVVALAPRQQKTLTLHIGLPKDEPPSDYYFSILFRSNNNTINQSTASGLSGGIATNVLLSVGPQGKTQGLLEDFSSPLFVQEGPIFFTIKVNNLSSHFIVPRGEINVRNMFGQLVGNIPLLPVNVLANTSRFLPGTTTNLASQAVWDEKVLFGPYRASLVVALSPSGPLFTRTIYFFAMPWEYIVGFFLTITLLSFIATRVRGRLKAQQ